MKNPVLGSEWAEAVDAAVWALAVDVAEKYGLITGPAVDVARCEEILVAARERGMRIPTLEEVLSR